MQALRIERARYIARTMDGTVEIRGHLVLTNDEIDTLVFRQRGSDAVAAAVNVDELARLRDAVGDVM